MLIKAKYLPTVIHQLGKNAGAWIPMGVGKWYSTALEVRLASPTFGEFVEIRLGADAVSPTGDIDIYIYYSMRGYGSPVNDNPTEQPVYPAGSGYTPPALPAPFNLSEVRSRGPAGDMELPSGNPNGLSVKKVGTFGFNAKSSNAKDLIVTQFNVADHFGGIVPPMFAIIVRNGTSAPLYGCSDYGIFSIADALPNAGPWCQITGVQAEAV